MPTITQLDYVLALHRTGHFGRAADACGVSQPTLSAQIAKVEEELGLTLFDRRARPIVVTEPGRLVIERAREVVVAHERLLAATRPDRELSGSFSLGVIPTLAPYVLPWFLDAFATQHPAVELTVLERTTEEIVRELHAMRVDGGLLATPLGEPGFDTHVAFYDPFYVYAHPGSPLLEGDEVDISALQDEELWLLSDGHCFRHQMVQICGIAHRSVLPSVRFEAGSFETLRALIDRVRGSTLVPESYARTLPPDTRLARVRPFRDPVPTREISVVGLRTHWKTDIARAIVGVLRAHAPRSLPRELTGELLPPAA